MITLADMMTTEVHTMAKGDTVQFARMLMISRHIHHVPIVDKQGQLLGLVTHRDLLSASHSDQQDIDSAIKHQEDNTRLGSIMTTDLFVMKPSDRMLDAARHLLENRQACVPVVDDGKLVGIVTSFDFIRIASDYLQEIDGSF